MTLIIFFKTLLVNILLNFIQIIDFILTILLVPLINVFNCMSIYNENLIVMFVTFLFILIIIIPNYRSYLSRLNFYKRNKIFLLKEFYEYIKYYRFNEKFQSYYKTLIQFNIKKLLVGSSIILLFLISLLAFDIFIQLVNIIDYNNYNLYNNNFQNIYNLINIKLCFNQSFLLYVKILIIFYTIFHTLLGFYMIFFDYLKNDAFLLILILEIPLFIGFFYLTI